MPAIIERTLYDVVQRTYCERIQKYVPENPGVRKHPFSGMLICSGCGKSYKRKESYGIASWNCGTSLRKGKGSCFGKQIPESILMSITADILNMDEFSEEAMRGQFLRIEVPEARHLRFVYKNGQMVDRIWTPPSRRDSWDDAMRKHARAQSIRRLQHE